MDMSGVESRKIDIDMVHTYIEQCLKLYMSKKEAANALFLQQNIEPRITEIVWQRLEDQNQGFFKAYYLKLMVKEQIMEFNRLLAEQVDLMRRTGLVNIPSMPMPNGSNISPVQQMPHTGETLGCALGSSDVHAPMMTNFPNAFINHGTTMDSCMQSALGMSGNGRGVGVPFNMLLAQNRSMGMRPTQNGMVIKRESDYATSSFNYAPPNNFMRSHPAMDDASMPSFSSVDSSLQSLNGSILDNHASSFGLLGHFSQNFSLHNTNMTSGISTNHDALNGYSEAQFLASDSNNILDPRGLACCQDRKVYVNNSCHLGKRPDWIFYRRSGCKVKYVGFCVASCTLLRVTDRRR